MKSSSKTSDAHKTWDYEPLRLVAHESIQQTEDIFAGQTSQQAQRMRADIQRVARRPFNILITGETGTGKTEMARQIHRLSVRANKPFIELNCANLPEQLVEAELFGHRKGAFTGADCDRKGLFEEADGGILFLDEIGDVPLTIQNRLLKAIDEKQIKRLGTNHYRFCDVQIIAATSRDLTKMIASHEFRKDLYCRLAVLTLEAMPLRERREDIPSMTARFLREASTGIAGPSKECWVYRIEDDALTILTELNYPGNIRTLRNLIYDLTSYIEVSESISSELVRFSLSKTRIIGDIQRPAPNNDAAIDDGNCGSRVSGKTMDPYALESLLMSITKEGDILLPLELCLLRRHESFKQWTARAKRCSIEAARQASGGSMRAAAERLGLTRSSLKNHLHRAKRAQSETLFAWQREND